MTDQSDYGLLFVWFLIAVWHVALMRSHENVPADYERAYFLLVAEGYSLALSDLQYEISPIGLLPHTLIRGLFFCSLIGIAAALKLAPKLMPKLVSEATNPRPGVVMFYIIAAPIYVYGVYILGVMLNLWSPPAIN